MGRARNIARTTLNINEASKVCGLSPSVLRIWEHRYGWPSPKRKPNGYRSYDAHQIQELKRMGELVKGGTAVSSLIIEGMPRWPDTHSGITGRMPMTITQALLTSKDRLLIGLQEELLEALRSRRGSLVKEVLQRGMWQVRPAEEIQAIHVPTLVGLAELERGDRPLTNADDVRDMIIQRCIQLLWPFHRTGEDPIWIVRGSPRDQALAAIAALVLNQHAHHAMPWTGDGLPPTGQIILAGDGKLLEGEHARIICRVSALGGEGRLGLAEVVHFDALSAAPV